MTYETYEVRIYKNGDEFWYRNGKLHREDGPAVEWTDGSKFWYRNGKYHREDGPAIEYANGDKFWYRNGKQRTEEKFNREMDPVKEMTVEEISKALGYEVKGVKG